MADTLEKYLLADHGTRIQTVDLRDAWRTGLAHQTLPPAVRALLGELSAAAVLLASSLKFDGSLILQMQGDGPVALMVAECDAQLRLRATASLRNDVDLPPDGTLASLLNPHGGGRFALILDPRNRAEGQQPYQGVVPLQDDSVAQALEHYMRQSEQLDTRLWLAADEHRAAGLLLQRLPAHGGHGQASLAAMDDGWTTAAALADTLRPGELLSLDGPTLMHRLFHQLPLTSYAPQRVQWHCPCSRERVSNMLRMLGTPELEDMLAGQADIEVACNFCGKPYVFDPVDLAGLLTGAQEGGQPPTTH